MPELPGRHQTAPREFWPLQNCPFQRLACCLCFPFCCNVCSISGQTGRVVGRDEDWTEVFLSPYFLHSHVCWLPSLVARGPGQPPHSCCGDREAADAGAAPAGCSEASAGKAGLGKRPLSLGMLPMGSAYISHCDIGFVFVLLRDFLFPLPKEVFPTAVYLFACFNRI